MSVAYKEIDIKELDNYKPLDGEICKILDGEDSSYQVYHNGVWNRINAEGMNLSLYAINKQIISQMPVIENINEKIDLINNFCREWNNKFYMMYGKGISYFTLFNIVNENYELENLGEGVIDCLSSLGDIKSIELTAAADAVEIWVQTEDDGCECLYLFPYDTGVVEVGQ